MPLADLLQWLASARKTGTLSVRDERFTKQIYIKEGRIISSASGDGGDAARILLLEVRAHLAAELGAGARVLVGVPERDLLVAGALVDGDEEFAALFAEFIRDDAAGADQPLDARLHEIVAGELQAFEA